ncbi:MAG: hypothetical protein D6778_02300 [Nitrospirae bacterium]|nr:MAG: hypothetical protein D6778_02300 [Nitrospirota bacterium]
MHGIRNNFITFFDFLPYQMSDLSARCIVKDLAEVVEGLRIAEKHPMAFSFCKFLTVLYEDSHF